MRQEKQQKEYPQVEGRIRIIHFQGLGQAHIRRYGYPNHMLQTKPAMSKETLGRDMQQEQ